MTHKSLTVMCILCVTPCVAEAYIGPGAGISAIGSFLALIGGVFLAIVGFVWFPIKRRFFKKKVGDEAELTGAEESGADPQKDDAQYDANWRKPGA